MVPQDVKPIPEWGRARCVQWRQERKRETKCLSLPRPPFRLFFAGGAIAARCGSRRRGTGLPCGRAELPRLSQKMRRSFDSRDRRLLAGVLAWEYAPARRRRSRVLRQSPPFSPLLPSRRPGASARCRRSQLARSAMSAILPRPAVSLKWTERAILRAWGGIISSWDAILRSWCAII